MITTTYKTYKQTMSHISEKHLKGPNTKIDSKFNVRLQSLQMYKEFNG